MSDPRERPANADDDAEEARQKGSDLEYDAQDQKALEQDDDLPSDGGGDEA